ncbi:hypothetical protein RUND412_001543 [Rhizina undulata]
MSLASLPRQTLALAEKTIRIILFRHRIATWYRAFILPVIFTSFMSYARNLFVPPAIYGISDIAPVRDLATAVASHPDLKLVFVTNNLGGSVQTLVDELSAGVSQKGGTVVVLTDPVTELQRECKQSLLGASGCFAAAVFYSGGENGWNYTIRGDSAFESGKINVNNHDNDVQERLIPLQYAIDSAIANMEKQGSGGAQVNEFMYTSESEKQREEDIRTRYMSAITNYISIAFFIGLVGLIYQLVGLQASERERGLATLVEAMGGSKAARFLSVHIAFDIVYLAGWVLMAVNIHTGIFARTSAGIIVIWYILTGLSLSSWSIFGAAFFKKAQLSGITVTIFSLVLGVIAQILSKASTATFAILGFLFPPMNFVFFSITVARWERQSLGASLTQSPPDSNSRLPAIALWIFLVVQIIVYPILASYVERALYGTASPRHRSMNSSQITPGNAVELRGFTKRYPPGFISSKFGKKETVTAVNSLDLDIRQGQIMVLLGANGSGKTTTLEAICGLGSVTEGDIKILTSGGNLGICPQKNVLWDDLTVEEHVKIWNRLKCSGDDKETLRKLIQDCDLEPKRKALSKTLSGGQKRKLQLAAMFTGGSQVCAVDEVSSGLDPLSRRKIWDIILAERGARTIVMTTHFLDEADLLADHIAILAKGELKCEGSAVELKARLGGGYRVNTTGDGPELEGVSTKRLYDQTVYNIPDSASAGRLVNELEGLGVEEYHVSGPTIEDVFLKVVEEVAPAGTEANLTVSEKNGDAASSTDCEDKGGVNLHNGSRLSILKQTWVMFRKRIIIFRRNKLPTMAAILIPLLASGLCMIFLHKIQRATCSLAAQTSLASVVNFDFQPNYDFVLGPPDQFPQERVLSLAQLLLPNSSTSSSSSGSAGNLSSLTNALHFVNSYTDFQTYISNNYANVTPGGIFVNANGSATYAFQGDGGLRTAMVMQNLVDNIVFNVSGGGIHTQYADFDYTWAVDQGKTLEFVVYFALAMAAFPAFFALYPTVERIRNVRALHYSNGVRVLPLWLAYVLFDFIAVLTISVVSVIIFVGTLPDGWYYVGYLFLVMMLYGLASINLAYVISLMAKSQLAAFAFTAGLQAVMFLLYFLAYLSVLTYAPVTQTNHVLNIVHFAFSAVTPIGSLIRALFVSLNVFAVICRGEQEASYPGEITLYGGPIVYLIVQSLLLFGILLWWDSGKFRLRFNRSKKFKVDADAEQEIESREKEISDELRRVDSANDGLRVLHLSKAFGKSVAVEDVTFGVAKGEVFALLGPNGAGKTTVMNMIRGDLAPGAGDVFVENVSVRKRRAAAREHLGVCPQFDAMDRMTVVEHLRFYAQVRGVRDVEHNVNEVIKAVGLDAYKHRMAEKLSGGNKRKLSLGIALMGNPSVLLLDEPSSGMDAAAKRVMWRTLASVVPGRSLVLTTHSMEEADALASRAGILSKRMLALGTSEYLRRKHGDAYHIHLVLKSAPNSEEREIEIVKDWIRASFEGAVVEEQSFHGQIKFSVPATRTVEAEVRNVGGDEIMEGEGQGEGGMRRGVNRVFAMLEENKKELGLEYYSVSQTTLDQVFLTIVGKANVLEEGYGEARKKRFWERWRK